MKTACWEQHKQNCGRNIYIRFGGAETEAEVQLVENPGGSGVGLN